MTTTVREVFPMLRGVRSSIVAALVLALVMVPVSPSTAEVGAWDAPITVSDTDYNASSPQVSSDGQTVATVWYRFDGSNYRIQVVTSLNGGTSWSGAVNLSGAGRDAFAPQVVVHGDTITSVWYRYDGSDYRVQTSTSTDSGATWSTPVTLSDAGQFAGSPFIATDGSRLTAVWHRSDGPNLRIQTSTSTDSGASWSAPVTLSGAGLTAVDPKVVTDGTTITAIWKRNDGVNERIQTSSSTDGGATWSAPMTLSGSGQDADAQQIVTDGSTITAIWTRLDGSYSRAEVATSTDAGATWSSPIILSAGGADAVGPQVVTDGATITAVWTRYTGSAAFIQATSSSDGGGTWSAPVSISDEALSSTAPHLVTDGYVITAVWDLYTGSEGRIQAAASTDGGITWSAPATLSQSGRDASASQAAATGDTVTVVWTRSDGVADRVQVSNFTYPPVVSRLSGSNRYETSVAISSEFSPNVPVVYLATGTNYPDALSAASAAAVQGGPLLLTMPTSLPTVISDELVRLNPSLVVIAGGVGVVSPDVEAAVQALLPSATVRRDAGANRYATSRAIAENAFPAATTTLAYIATGSNFPDALSASAAAGTAGVPVILVNGTGTGIDLETQGLLSTLGVTNVIIAGGTGVVNTAVENSLKTILGAPNVVRLSGANRYATSVAINADAFSSADTAFLATGLGFADALAGAALAGNVGAPLYVVPPTCVPPAVLVDLSKLGARYVVLLGGTGVLSVSVASLTSC